MSNLLSQASLVMIPSGYKEDVVYSPVPTNGNGDLSFTRASSGTRINSAGLVEVCPWNLLQYSEEFSNSWWQKDLGATVDSNVATAPNGTTTADRLNFSGAGQAVYRVQSFNGSNTFSVYLKGEGSNIGKQIYLEVGVTATVTLTGEWQRFEVNADNSASVAIKRNTSGQASSVLAWGIQVNAGTLKPYFPTTDRLNVPRLTYQNGGGGCPSLLLEKQSTNGLYPSEDFSTTWLLFNSATVTTNQTTSPNGTQSADKLTTTNQGTAIYNVNGAGASAQAYTASLFIKYIDNTEFAIGMTDDVTGEAFARFNFTTGTATTTLQGDWTSISYAWEQQANGWYRISVTATKGASGNARFIGKGGGAYNYYIWGAQVEASSYKTSYIPTTSSSATRVADECKKSGIGALIGGTSGTLFFDIKTNPTLSSSNYKQFCYYVTSGGSQSYLYLDGANKITTNATWGSLFYNTALQPNTRYKVALVFAPNDFALYINGVSVATASSGTPNNNVDLQIGQFNGTEMCEFVFNQYTHFPSRLTNAELASLTTI